MKAINNAYVSQSRIKKELGRIIDLTSTSECILFTEQPVFVCERNNIKVTVARYRAMAVPYCIPCEDMQDEEEISRVVSENHYYNQAKGRKIGVQRKKHCRGLKGMGHHHLAGGGFSFKPEIAWHRAGNGEYLSADGEYFESDEEAFYHPRYERKNHAHQSMPKIEWAVERKWRNNKKIKRVRTAWSKVYQERVKENRETVMENPRKAFGRDGTYYRAD